ncbi:hypothetical protein TTRE_0000964201 [Trichuris trichiura]|uniref:Uncharacterized protein n=1 Tax=Trichuris trichiura TaxID=36087 RepID=A0A077ZN41_TRITR|nr:hypothetical protein TTRE_0000964201 [Trichuris trichiura]
MNANCTTIDNEEKVARLNKVRSLCIVEIDSYEKSGYYSCEACLLIANVVRREHCFPDKRTSTQAEIVVKGPFQLVETIDNGTHIYIEFNANPMHYALLEYWIDDVSFIRKERSRGDIPNARRITGNWNRIAIDKENVLLTDQ